MVFVYRAAIVAVAAFVSALIGFGVQRLLPAAYVVGRKAWSARSWGWSLRFWRWS